MRADDSAEPRIGVVIPNWNGGHHFRRCLESLAAQVGPRPELVVVDNGSGDESWKLVEEIVPGAELLRLDRNYGFGHAVNRGIEQLDTDWVLLLNNDVVLDRRFLETLREAISSKPDLDIVATKLLNAARPEILDGTGDALLMGGGAYRIGHGLSDDGAWNERREVFGACAAAALYRRALLLELGKVDADFFAYLEDVDLSMRARWAGARCIYVSEAVALHEGSKTLGDLSGPVVRLITRNQLLLVAKNYPLALLVRLFPRLIGFQVLWFLFSVRRKAVGYWTLGVLGALVRLPQAFVKRGQITRRVSNAEMLLELKRSEWDVWEHFRANGSPPNALLRYYFWLFRPREPFPPRTGET